MIYDAVAQVTTVLHTIEKDESACLLEALCRVEEEQRFSFFTLFLQDAKNADLFNNFFPDELLFLLYALPKHKRLEWLVLIKKYTFNHLWISLATLEHISYFLEGIPNELWPNLLDFFPIYFNKEESLTYFSFRLFNDQQLHILKEYAQFKPFPYDNTYRELSSNEFSRKERFAEWQSTLVALNEALQNTELCLQLLKPLDEAIAQSFPYYPPKQECARLYNYFFPSVIAYRTTPRYHYDQILDELLLFKEQKNGLNKGGIPYFSESIPPEIISQFLEEYLHSVFKEIIMSERVFLHGSNIHRLQWYVIQALIESKIICLPEGQTISTLYEVFMEVEFAGKKIWDVLIDRAKYYSSYVFQCPETLQSYLLSSPKVKQRLPHLNAYLANSFFKKIDRILSLPQPMGLKDLGEKIGKNYKNLIKNTVNHAFFSIDSKIESVSFLESFKQATSDNEKRIIKCYFNQKDKPFGLGIFFKIPRSRASQSEKDYTFGV